MKELNKLKLTKIRENIVQYVELINLELEFKDEKAITALVRMSGFPYLKTFEDFYFTFQSTIKKGRNNGFQKFKIYRK